jgi:hypothetical protein
MLDAALGKLPRILPDPPAPEQAALGIAQNDANIGTESFCVDQGLFPRQSCCDFFTLIPAPQGR